MGQGADAIGPRKTAGSRAFACAPRAGSTLT